MNIKSFLVFMYVLVDVFGVLFAQTKTEHFIYNKEGNYFRVFLKGKEHVGTFLSKVDVRLEGQGVDWIVKARVEPFQALIDDGTFSKERMKELEEYDEPLGIYVFFNETGIVSDIYFLIPTKKSSLLTDKELYAIYQKYLGTVFDLSNVTAWDDNSLTPKVRKNFLSLDYFHIPFKRLDY